MSSTPPTTPPGSPDSSAIPAEPAPAESTPAESEIVTPPDGDYRWEIRRGGVVMATEEVKLDGGRLTGTRRISESGDRHEVEADLGDDRLIRRLVLHYSRGPFTRTATFESADEFLRGSITALGGRDNFIVKLGRFREIDGDLVIFKSFIIARARARGQLRFTGRIASIDPATLMATTYKQTYRRGGNDDLRWIYEPRMGDTESIELDERGVVVRRIDARGNETILVGATTSASGRANTILTKAGGAGNADSD